MVKNFILFILILSLVVPYLAAPKPVLADSASDSAKSMYIAAAVAFIALGVAACATDWFTTVPSGLTLKCLEKNKEVVKDTKNKVIDFIYKFLKETLKKKLLDYIVDQIVNWIQGGGKPKFIGNWESFLKNVEDIAFDSVASEIKNAYGVDLCSPFGLQVRMAFLPVEKFSKRIKCSLDKFVSNLENFYIDFSVGGWEGYLASWEPNNNFYGVILTAIDEKAAREANKKDAAKSQGIAGKGFLSVTKCKSGSGIGNYDSNFKSAYENSRGCNSDGISEEFRELCKSGAKAKFQEDMKSVGYTEATSGEYCDPKDLENTTPGALVGDMIAKASGADIDSIVNAEDLSKYVAAITNALINRMMKEGLSAVSSNRSRGNTYTIDNKGNISFDLTKEDKKELSEYESDLEELDSKLSAEKNSSTGDQIVYSGSSGQLIGSYRITNSNSSSVVLKQIIINTAYSDVFTNLSLKVDSVPFGSSGSGPNVIFSGSALIDAKKAAIINIYADVSSNAEKGTKNSATKFAGCIGALNSENSTIVSCDPYNFNGQNVTIKTVLIPSKSSSASDPLIVYTGRQFDQIIGEYLITNPSNKDKFTLTSITIDNVYPNAFTDLSLEINGVSFGSSGSGSSVIFSDSITIEAGESLAIKIYANVASNAVVGAIKGATILSSCSGDNIVCSKSVTGQDVNVMRSYYY